MREKILKRLASWHAAHPWRMLLIVVLLTVILGGFASQIGINPRMSELLPKKDPKVVQFNRIIEEFATATNLIVLVQARSSVSKSLPMLSLPGF